MQPTLLKHKDLKEVMGKILRQFEEEAQIQPGQAIFTSWSSSRDHHDPLYTLQEAEVAEEV